MTELTILPSENQALTTEPNYQGLLDMAHNFSESALCPKVLKGKPQDIAVVMLAGRDYGISDFQAVFGTGALYVIDGRLSMEAQLMRALCLSSPACEYLQEVESTPDKSTWVTQRQGAPKPDIETFTLAEARAQGLLKKPNWSGNPGPRTMLSHRASARLCRRVYPDILKGISYTPEELKEGLSEPAEQKEAATSRVEALIASLGPAEPEEPANEGEPEVGPTPEAEKEAFDAEMRFEVNSKELEEYYLGKFQEAADLEEVEAVYADARSLKGKYTPASVEAIKRGRTEALARLK